VIKLYNTCTGSYDIQKTDEEKKKRITSNKATNYDTILSVIHSVKADAATHDNRTKKVIDDKQTMSTTQLRSAKMINRNTV
jgi:hypothetical protein